MKIKGQVLALKDNIDAVKKEIGTEEQFLESIIKSERFFKRYKKYIISAVAVLVIGGVTYATMNVMEEKRLEASNAAYNTLLKNPKDAEALSVLKTENERLYNFFRFQEALKNESAEGLKELASLQNDPIISDLAAYQLSGLESGEIKNSELLKGFVFLQEGYKLLVDGKVVDAKLKFSQIDMNSPLKNISNSLEHYQGGK